MNRDKFLAYEHDCIRQASGRPEAKIRPLKRPGGLRSRTYLLDGPNGGSFVKCLDAGYSNPANFFPTLDNEAEGYRFFAGFDDGLAAVPEVYFFQSFPGSADQELQVLGMTNLDALGVVQSPRDIYWDPAVHVERKEAVASLCGRALARLTSTEFQGSLDRVTGVAAIRLQTDKFLDHPRREQLLASVGNHAALPWAYQNKVMGEMNVLLPRWLEMAGREATPETRAKLNQIGHVLTDREMLDALSPGQSSDRIIFSPRDRNDGNTLLVLDGDEVRRIFEVDLEFWGLETGGRLVGRYVAIQRTAGSYNGAVQKRVRPAAEGMLMGAFLYHFILGDGRDTPELALRAVSVGLAGFHAAICWLYMAALEPLGIPNLLDDALACLRAPDRFLALAADYAGSQQGDQAELVVETVEQVRTALHPLIALAARFL